MGLAPGIKYMPKSIFLCGGILGKSLGTTSGNPSLRGPNLKEESQIQGP